MNRSIFALIAVALLASNGIAQNDECAGALPMVLGTNPAPPASGNTYTMNGATLSAGWAVPTCQTSISADVWFSFVPATTGIYQVDTEWPAGFASGTLLDTVLEVFPDTLCVPGPAIACDDDSGVTSGLLSLLTVSLNAGLTYYVRCSDFSAFSGGSFYINVTFLGLPVANDECTGAIPVTLGTNPAPASSGNTFTNNPATTSPGWALNCSGVNIAKDVWYAFTPGSSGVYRIDTETPSGFTAGTITDTILEVYNSGCAVATAIGCDDDSGVTGGGLLSLLLVNLTAGVPYQIRVGPYALAAVQSGTFYINVALIGPPLVNDECSGATPIALGTNPAPAASGNTFSNAGATTSAGFPAPCATFFNDVWFSFTPAATDTYVFDTNTPCGFAAGTMTNTTLALYSAASCASPAAAIACDPDSGAGSLSLLSAALTSGSTYYLRVGPTTNVAQTFYVNVRQGALGTNDACASAIPLNLGTNPSPVSCSQYNNDGTTDSTGYPAVCGAILRDVWFSFAPATSGSYIIDTNTPCGFTPGTATNTTIALYPSCAVGAALVSDCDSGKTALSLINIALISGTTYYLRVGVTATTGTGTFYVNVNPGVATSPNDTCATAIAVGLGTNPAPAASCNTFENAFATSDTSVPAYPAVCGTIVNDVWFVFTPPVSGDYRIDTETPAGFAAGTNTNTTVAVYGSCTPGIAALACDADSGVTGTGTNSIVTATGLVAGTPYYIRVGSTSITAASETTGTFYLTITRVFSLVFSSPFGPGSLKADILAGPPSGSYFMCATLNAGAFPAGYFFGIAPLFQEILDQLNVGFPFVGPLDAAGDFTIGPVGGLPSGFTLYAVAIGFAGPIIDFPAGNTTPETYTIP